MFARRLTVLIALALAGVLALGVMSALADHEPDHEGDEVACDVEQDVEDVEDVEQKETCEDAADDSGDAEESDADDSDDSAEVDDSEDATAAEVEVEENGSGQGHEACSAATEHALSVLESLHDEGRPVDRAIEAVTNCGTGAGHTDGNIEEFGVDDGDVEDVDDGDTEENEAE